MRIEEANITVKEPGRTILLLLTITLEGNTVQVLCRLDSEKPG